MKNKNIIQRELYYTNTHEWIEFNQDYAIVGISTFRLIDVKEIKKIDFFRVYGDKKKGDVIAKIKADRKLIEVHMPVDGTIVSINDSHRLIHQNLLIDFTETTGWLVKIRPGHLCSRNGLIPSLRQSTTGLTILLSNQV